MRTHAKLIIVLGLATLSLVGCGSSGGAGARRHANQAHATIAAATTTTNPAPPTGCFGDLAKCGFPGPTNGSVGPSSPCSSLPYRRSITAAKPGEVIAHVHVHGQIRITAPNVTIDQVCVTYNGRAQLGSAAIAVQGPATNALIENSTIAGVDDSGESFDIAAYNFGAQGATLSHDDIYNCGECVYDQPWKIDDSYVLSNGMRGTTDHIEDVYCDDGNVTIDHSTLLNPQSSVAVVFCDTNDGKPGGSCANQVSVTNSLLAGGGFVIYACGNARSVGSSTMTVSNNRFARCITRPIIQTRDGGYDCGGNTGDTARSGSDPDGYWPYGGHGGVSAYTFCTAPGQTWTGNVWDNDNAVVAC